MNSIENVRDGFFGFDDIFLEGFISRLELGLIDEELSFGLGFVLKLLFNLFELELKLKPSQLVYRT